MTAGPMPTWSPGWRVVGTSMRWPLTRVPRDTAEVLDHADIPVPGKATVLTGDLDVGEFEIGIGGTARDETALAERENATGQSARYREMRSAHVRGPIKVKLPAQISTMRLLF